MSELQDLIGKKGLVLELKLSSKPMPAGFDRSGSAFVATLRYKGRKVTTPFYAGSGAVKRGIDAADVLASLILDTTAYENARDVNDFANEFGYDLEDRDTRLRVHNMWRQMKAMAPKIRAFLGDEFDEFASAEH